MSDAHSSLAPKEKDTSGILPVISPFVPLSTLCAALLAPAPLPGPRLQGSVEGIVLRPSVNAREVVPSARLDVDGGVIGGGWTWSMAKKRTDQVCVMGARVIKEVCAGGDDVDEWAGAGDQLFFDFALDEENLKTGDCVRVGSDVLLQVTRKPHTGCMKFVKRYGMDALKVVNCPEGRRRRLRGIYFCVLTGGEVKVGDTIAKVPKPQGV